MAGIDSSISIEMDSYNTEEVEKLHRLMNARALRKKRNPQNSAGLREYSVCLVHVVPAFVFRQRFHYAGRRTFYNGFEYSSVEPDF